MHQHSFPIRFVIRYFETITQDDANFEERIAQPLGPNSYLTCDCLFRTDDYSGRHFVSAQFFERLIGGKRELARARRDCEVGYLPA